MRVLGSFYVTLCVSFLLAPSHASAQRIERASLVTFVKPISAAAVHSLPRPDSTSLVRVHTVYSPFIVLVDSSSTKKVNSGQSFPKRTLIGAAIGGLLGYAVCAVLAEGPITSDQGTFVTLVGVPAIVGGLLGYAAERR